MTIKGEFSPYLCPVARRAQIFNNIYLDESVYSDTIRAPALSIVDFAALLHRLL
jgi:hypothetical protein